MDDDQQDEYILKEMYVPPAVRDKSVTEHELVDLVFVHGLGGHLRRTWKQEGTYEPWFEKPEFLGRLKDRVRVLSFGYNANRFGDVANTRIIHHANDLLRNLVLKRLDDPNRPLILIAHSLGGLVVKRAILLCPTNDDWGAIKSSTKSIIFMGTPHMGSEKAEDLVVVQKLASLMKFQAPVATNLTKELKTFSTAVQDINMEFTIDVHRSIELLCCYESHPQRLPNGSKEIIVPQWSAVLQGVDNIDLNCSHSALSKFASPSDPRFELFWGEVQRLVRKATAPPPKLTKVPTWTDEEVTPATPPRGRQTVPPRRRHEVAQKGLKPSRASVIRSSANEILKEVRRGIAQESPETPEGALQMEPEQQHARLDPKEFNDFIRLLRTITPENKGLDREQPHWQTCQWILSDPFFQGWRESDKGGLLFITGNPGCGKSNLAKFIQGVMEKSRTDNGEEPLVVSFYCDSLESSRANPPILDWVVKFLVGKRINVTHSVLKKLRSLLDPLILDRKIHLFDHLMEVVQTLVVESNGVSACLVIDGLDQCEGEFILKLLRGLDTMLRREGPRSSLKIVVTSRMTDTIRGFALSNSHIGITPQTIGEDIQRVVDEEVDRILLARQIATVERSSVSAVIVERANGSFLFASSVLKELWHIKDTGANSVFTLVTSCPSTMEAIYQQDMNRLEAERTDLLMLIQFLCIARRALRLSEARAILHVQNPDITKNYDLNGDLTRMCQRLVKFGGEDDTVDLLHQTLYDFITNTYDVAALHENFAEVCLDYLSKMSESTWGKAIAHRNQRRRHQKSPVPFLYYASVWMSYHFRNAGVLGKEYAWEIWDFLCSEQGKCWQIFNLPPGVGLLRSEPTDVDPALPWASSKSLTSADHSSSSDTDADSDTEWDRRGRKRSRPARSPSPEIPDNNAYDSDPSVSSSRSRSIVTGDRPAKPPLVILAQWDVDEIIKEIFFSALESSPRQLLQSVLGMIPYYSNKSQYPSRKEFKRMVNEVWESTTALHYAAAQSGRALEVLLPFADNVNLPDSDGATPLTLASSAGQIKGVKLLLEAGAEVNHTDSWHQTSLYQSVHTDSAEVVRILLENGADPDIPAETGHTPLEVTIGKNNAEFAQIILEFSPDMRTRMSNGQPPQFLANRLYSYAVLEVLLPHIDVDQVYSGERLIHSCVWDGVENVVRKLIRLGANLDDPPANTPKATPVALAVECGHNSILKALLAAGAKVECPEPFLSCPLHLAALRGNVDACRQLVRAGCNIEAEGEYQRTALYVACDMVKLGVVELLVDLGADPNKPAYEPPLQVSADVGNLTLMSTLLGGRNAPIINAKGESDETALGIAANFGDLHQVALLLDHGADPNLRSGHRASNTPLQLAANNRHRETVIELLKRGAEAYPEHPKESSAFHLTCFDGFIDVIETFFEVVDDVDGLVNFEWGWYGTPLMQAALGGRVETVKLLLKRGADPNYVLKSKINRGKTILHAAAEGGNVDVFKAILEVIENPNLEVRDFKQRTPIYYACVEGREDMVDYLLEKEVDTNVVLITGENLTAGIIDGGSSKILKRVLEKNPDMDIDISRNTDGKTPLLFAVMHGRAEMISTLLEKGADVNRLSQTHDFALAEAIRYREKEALKVLLAHEATDLTQKDIFGRNSLQIAQDSGSHEMPGMIVAAIKTAELEAEIMGNRDMYGMNSFDHTRLDKPQELPLPQSLEGIRKEAESLLEDFALRGPRWERLGKYLLQIAAYTFAQVALQRSIEAVETTPLFLEHQVHCRLCLDLISTTRFTCKTCCNTDLCGHCINRYPSLGYRMWTCQYHTYFQVTMPGVEPRRGIWPRTGSTESIRQLVHLTTIEEGSEDESGDENPRESQPDYRVEGKNDRKYDSESDEDDSVCIVERPSRTHSQSPPPSYAEATRVPSSRKSDADPDDEEEEESRGRQSQRARKSEEYVELTEEQLRQFLEATLKIFTIGQTPEKLIKWHFDTEKWRPVYDRRPIFRGYDDIKAPELLFPREGLFSISPQLDAYNYLSGVAYLFAEAPAATGVKPRYENFHAAFGRQAAKKKRHLQRLIRKEINPERPFREVDPEVD